MKQAAYSSETTAVEIHEAVSTLIEQIAERGEA
jgi:hypothetical protein